MSLGSVTFVFSPTTASPAAVVPISGSSGWVTAIAAGGMTVTELTTGETYLADPSRITSSTRNVVSRPAYAGTTLRVSLYYQTSDTVDTTKPATTIRVFGRNSSSQPWVALRNLNNDASVAIPTDPAQDTIVAKQTSPALTWSQTVPDNNAHSWDTAGCSEFLVGIERIYGTIGSGSAPSVAYLLVRVV